jgi:hypothetical protein
VVVPVEVLWLLQHGHVRLLVWDVLRYVTHRKDAACSSTSISTSTSTLRSVDKHMCRHLRPSAAPPVRSLVQCPHQLLQSPAWRSAAAPVAAQAQSTTARLLCCGCPSALLLRDPAAGPAARLLPAPTLLRRACCPVTSRVRGRCSWTPCCASPFSGA